MCFDLSLDVIMPSCACGIVFKCVSYKLPCIHHLKFEAARKSQIELNFQFTSLWIILLLDMMPAGIPTSFPSYFCFCPILMWSFLLYVATFYTCTHIHTHVCVCVCVSVCVRLYLAIRSKS